MKPPEPLDVPARVDDASKAGAVMMLVPEVTVRTSTVRFGFTPEQLAQKMSTLIFFSVPVTVGVKVCPAKLVPEKPTPLVVVLHGYYTSPYYITGFFTLGKLADDQGVLVVAPDGNEDPSGNFYWNATDACCDGYGANPDEVVTRIRALPDAHIIRGNHDKAATGLASVEHFN